uniref:Ribosome production factor 2 homolog n=1 Tax=Sinocyclocheilus rhinocerous TaxID=307959 RepID=A0A673H2Y5_9TELE
MNTTTHSAKYRLIIVIDKILENMAILFLSISHSPSLSVTKPHMGSSASNSRLFALRQEFFSKKSDCSLFLFGSHNKKRPNNLIFGRMFDFHVLDMFELGIERFVSLRDVKTDTCPEGTKPLLVFAGELFETDREHQRLRSLLTDFFCGPRVSAVRLAGLEHVLHFTALEGKIYLRSYKVLLKKSGCRTPRIQLQDMGPSFDFVMRRNHMASDDLYRTAHRQPRGVKPKKKKNISHDAFGTRLGRLHMQKQDLDKLQTRKMKGLRKRRGEQTAETAAAKAPRTDE